MVWKLVAMIAAAMTFAGLLTESSGAKMEQHEISVAELYVRYILRKSSRMYQLRKFHVAEAEENLL